MNAEERTTWDEFTEAIQGGIILSHITEKCAGAILAADEVVRRAEAAEQRAVDAEHKTAAWRRAAKSWEARVADLRPRAEAAEAALEERTAELALLRHAAERELTELRAVAEAVSDDGDLSAADLRAWADSLERGLGYKRGGHICAWLRTMADALAAAVPGREK